MATGLLARLKAVFKDGSTPSVATPTAQPISLAQFTAGHIWVECVNEDGSVHSLTYDTLLLGVRFHPTDTAPAISLQGSNMDTDPDGEPADNWARFTLVPGHWADVPPRMYGYECVALVGGDPDDRLPAIPHSPWKVTAADVHPGDDVQVPDEQAPLAQGPQGETGPTGADGEDGLPGVAGSTGDIQPVGTAVAAGSTGKYADAGHVHPDRAVAGVAGSYTNASITVDAYGRITAAANGSGGEGEGEASSLSFTDELGTLNIGSDITGSTNRIFEFVPIEEGVAPFTIKISRDTNVAAPPDDWVLSLGLTGDTPGQAQFQLTIEQEYNARTECYIATNNEDGNAASRPFSIDLDRVTGGGTIAFNLDRMGLAIQAAAGGPARWRWTANGQASATPESGVTPLVLNPSANQTALNINGVDALRNNGGPDFDLYIGSSGSDNVSQRGLKVGNPALSVTGAFIALRQGTTAPKSTSNECRFAYDTANDVLLYSQEGGDYSPALVSIGTQGSAGATAGYFQVKLADGSTVAVEYKALS